MAGKPSIIVSPVDQLSDYQEGFGGGRPENEIKRLSAAFDNVDVGDLPEEEDLDASQEPGSMGGGTSGQTSTGGGRVLQGGLGRAQMGDGHNFGARS